ncbi:MAG: bifunctional UDP-N-acetylglucosamine diphosphorylase/glucosamine-1-phosphate N-acetyltransferase GlmU [Pseudomonadota bacterium]|nr:bifunctional UDP-N-acetylglucosamine diphosphorylase/glucosamine-1-phosphate N-acetyltransferase GlmU [Pseudomonadota bacterium]
MNAIILAAGQGKRMHSHLPKVLHRLAGRPILQYVIDAARAVGPDRVALVIGHEGDRVAAAVAEQDLVLVRQDPPRGTGDAVRRALAALPVDDVSLVMIGDAPLVSPDDLRAILDAARQGALALLTARVADPHGLGRIVRHASGEVRAIVEERDATPEERRIDEINSGMLACPTRELSRWVGALSDDNAQREYLLTDIVAMCVGEGVRVVSRCVADERDVRGINDRGQLVTLERILQRRRADALLLAGTWIADPDRIDIRGTLRCGRDVRIDVNCVFEGDVVLGDEVEIAANCVLRNTTVQSGSTIAPFTYCDDAIVGRDCRIGPYARLRPGAELASEVHVGNFVEVKASVIGERSKANHLAYIGDSSVGADVNIGAGTITCNYDGVNKHRTIIEDGAFIGSDTQLVAPVRVGRNATLGAGTTLTRDAPPDALTVSRTQQVTVPGWKRPLKKKA